MTERLIQIAKIIKSCDCVADIGTDHAYLPVYLIEQRICKCAIASDINCGPLLNARRTIHDKSLQDVVKLRQGGGFIPYSMGEADAYILAGMGGNLIANILDQKPKIPQNAKQLVIQPMQHPEVIRRYLCDNGYIIEKDKFVREKGKFYQIISAYYSGTISHYDDFTLIYGINPIKDATYYEFLSAKLKQTQSILRNLSSDKHPEKHCAVMNEQEKLKELISGN